MASYVDGVVPEAHREAYEATLALARGGADLPFEAVRRTVEEVRGAARPALLVVRGGAVRERVDRPGSIGRRSKTVARWP